MNKKLAGTGLAIGLVAGAGAGLILELSGAVGAASSNVTAVVGDSTDSTTPDATTPDATTPASGDTTTPVHADPSTKLGEVLKPLVDDGTITQDQADKVIAAIVAARPAGGPDGGHRGPGGFGGPGGLIGKGLDVVATTLGITNDEVLTALKNGQTLADLAVANGKTGQDVIDAIVAEATTRINTAVTDGKLTQAQADKAIAEVTTFTTDFVNNGGPAFGLGDHGFGHGFGGPMHGGDDGTAPSDTTATTGTVAG
jgi:polyhydroxyalkanoate synthesis regulator phasin